MNSFVVFLNNELPNTNSVSRKLRVLAESLPEAVGKLQTYLGENPLARVKMIEDEGKVDIQ